MDDLFRHDYVRRDQDPADPFVTPDDLDRERRMRLIADVTCDVTPTPTCCR